MHRRPPRLAAFDYSGQKAVFLTASTFQRAPAFSNRAFAREVTDQLLQCAAKHDVEDTAHCFMPDHVHALLTGRSAASSVLKAWHEWRQLTAFRWKRLTGSRLWQEGYWDRVLREEESALGVAAYIINNPVRAGLVSGAADYPLIGSGTYTMEELTTAVQMDCRWWR